MRIAYIAAGAAGSYCGACARDVRLGRALRGMGHEVVVFPLYTPLRADEDDISLDHVFYGAINVYLQQRFGIFRRMPRRVDAMLDRPGLLRMVSRFAVQTQPEELGEMTVSVLRGPDGRQRKELDKLLEYLERNGPWHVLNLSNSLLSGILPAARERLDAAVVCNLQGEDGFVDRLPGAYRREAHDLMQRHAGHVDAFVASYTGYATAMTEFLGVPAERIHVIPPGVAADEYRGEPGRGADQFRVGYFSRLTPAKGLDVLCRAFLRLVEEEPPGARRALLAIGGQVTSGYRDFWEDCRARLVAAGCGDRLEFVDTPDAAGKREFLRRCDVFCVPARHPQRTAMAWVEALAAGVPIVAPRRPSLDELVETTGGGVLVEPDSPRALADALAGLRDDPERLANLARAARTEALQRFSTRSTATATEQLYRDVTGNSW